MNRINTGLFWESDRGDVYISQYLSSLCSGELVNCCELMIANYTVD